MPTLYIMSKQGEAKRDGAINPQILNYKFNRFEHGKFWCSQKFYKSTEVDHITWLHVPTKLNRTSSTMFVVLGLGKPIWPSWPLIGWDIFGFFSTTAEQNTSENKYCLLLRSFSYMRRSKTKIAVLASDWPTHFGFLLCNCWTDLVEIHRK